MVVSAIVMSTQRCNEGGVFGSTLLRSFSFRVNQQSITAGGGKIVISNIHYGTDR